MIESLDLLDHAHLLATAAKDTEPWDTSPWRPLRYMSSPETGAAVERMAASWLTAHGFEVARPPRDEECDFIIDGSLRVELKGSRRSAWPPNRTRFRYRPIIDGKFHVVVFLGFLPGPEGDHRVWVAEKATLWDAPDVASDRDGRRGLAVKLEAPPEWMLNPSGTPASAVDALRALVDTP